MAVKITLEGDSCPCGIGREGKQAFIKRYTHTCV